MGRRLRALIGPLSFLALVFLLFPAGRRWLAVMLPHGGPAVYVADRLLQLASLLVFSSLAAVLERRPAAVYGLPWRLALRSRFWQGAGTGLVSLAVLMLALGVAGAMRVEWSSGSAIASAGLGAAYAALFLLLAVREEFLYRGYGLFTLSGAIRFWPAALVTTAWFTWAHADNPNESATGLLSVAFFGLLGCVVLKRTGNLWWVIGFHAAWNWGQTFLFGAGDSGHPAAPGQLLASAPAPGAPPWLSGGLVGPEGSVLCSVLFVLVALAAASRLRPERSARTRP